MKTDVLTFAAAVFIVGLVLSSFSFSEMFDSKEDAPVAVAQQGNVSR